MGYIAWTDEEGSTSLSNEKPGPARRFSSWEPDLDRVGPKRTALGTGKFYSFLYRTDKIARFRMEAVPVTASASFLRFKNYAMQGCSFHVYTEDASSRVYLCRLRPDTEPKMVMTDRQMLEYSIDLEVMSAEDVSEDLICHYRE